MNTPQSISAPELQRWLELGGHADGEVDLAQVALREGDEAAARTILAELTEEADATIGARERARELLRALGDTT